MPFIDFLPSHRQSLAFLLTLLRKPFMETVNSAIKGLRSSVNSAIKGTANESYKKLAFPIGYVTIPSH